MDFEVFEFFKSEMGDTDVIIRTEAMTKLPLVACLMGPERVRNELLPFIKSITTDMDQVLLVLATVLGDFLNFIGGPDHATALIPLIEKLCNSEDVVVRNTIAVSTSKILKHAPLNKPEISQPFFEMYQKLCADDSEIFYGRMSGSLLTPDIYRVASTTERTTIMEIFTKLVSDEMSMVRKACGQVYMKLLDHINSETFTTELLNLMKIMITDENTSVRCVAYENTGTFARHMKRLNATNTIMGDFSKIIHHATDDPSWKMRHALAKNCGVFPSSFSSTLIVSDIFPGLLTLLQDAEPDVRVAAIEGIATYIEPLTPSVFLSEMTMIIPHLVDDPLPTVKKALIDACIIILIQIKDIDGNQMIIDSILKLVQDEDPMVRLRVLKNLNAISAELTSLCEVLTTYLIKMFHDSNWRIRKEIGYSMQFIIKNMGIEYFNNHYISDFLLLLKDDVDDVRNEVSKVLPVLADFIPEKDFIEQVFPLIRDMVKQEYLMRITVLNTLQGLLNLAYEENFHMDVIRLIASLTNDVVPNIRLKVAQVLGQILSSKSTESVEILKSIHESLNILSNDNDKDVKYFADTALQHSSR